MVTGPVATQTAHAMVTGSRLFPAGAGIVFGERPGVGPRAGLRGEPILHPIATIRCGIGRLLLERCGLIPIRAFRIPGQPPLSRARPILPDRAGRRDQPVDRIPSIGIERNPMAGFASRTKLDWSVDHDTLVAHAKEAAARILPRSARRPSGGVVYTFEGPQGHTVSKAAPTAHALLSSCTLHGAARTPP